MEAGRVAVPRFEHESKLGLSKSHWRAGPTEVGRLPRHSSKRVHGGVEAEFTHMARPGQHHHKSHSEPPPGTGISE